MITTQLSNTISWRLLAEVHVSSIQQMVWKSPLRGYGQPTGALQNELRWSARVSAGKGYESNHVTAKNLCGPSATYTMMLHHVDLKKATCMEEQKKRIGITLADWILCWGCVWTCHTFQWKLLHHDKEDQRGPCCERITPCRFHRWVELWIWRGS